MATTTIYLPISPYSINPVADAEALLKARTTDPLPAATKRHYWSDPCTALGQGTGRWMFQIAVQHVPATTDEALIYIAYCQGNASTSVGGASAAPAPSFAGMTAVGHDFMGTGGPASPPIQGKTQIFVSPTKPSTLPADIAALLMAWGSISGVSGRYYNDPQTSLGIGTGIWKMSAILKNSSYQDTVIIESGACALESVGGQPAVPAPTFTGGFTSWTRVNSLYALQ